MHRDRRGSLGMDSCDYNSNSSGYFDEHAEYDNQQQAVYEFQQNTSQKNQWHSRGKGAHEPQQSSSRQAQLHHNSGQHYSYSSEKDEWPVESNSREHYSYEKGQSTPQKGQSCLKHHQFNGRSRNSYGQKSLM